MVSIRHFVALGCVLLCISAAGVAVGAGDTQRATAATHSERVDIAPTQPIAYDTDGITLRVVPNRSTVAPGETAAVRFSLSEAPEGIAGFNITGTVDNPAILQIRQANASDTFGLEETTRTGDSASMKGVDIGEEVGPGSSNVTLAVMTLEAQQEGTAQITIRSNQLDADDGSRISVTGQTAEITVSANQTGPTEGPGPPGSPDPEPTTTPPFETPGSIGEPGLPDSAELTETPTPTGETPEATQTQTAERPATPTLTASSTVATTTDPAGETGPGFGLAVSILALLLTGSLVARLR